jgi:hypothetical protein
VQEDTVRERVQYLYSGYLRACRTTRPKCRGGIEEKAKEVVIERLNHVGVHQNALWSRLTREWQVVEYHSPVDHQSANMVVLLCCVELIGRRWRAGTSRRWPLGLAGCTE